MNKFLIVVVGPTAIGKTNLAIRIAQEFDTDIFSADSRQFYREMEIGTAKPSAGELSSARHHFVNSHSISDKFSVGNFEQEVTVALDELYKTKDIAVLVGGSGLYINAVTHGFDDLPKENIELREQLNTLFAKEGLLPLQNQLKELDPAYYETVDINNPQRIIRALEVSISTGRPYSSFRQNQKKERQFQTVKIGLNIDRGKLYDRINARVDQMVAAGLVNEVKSLLPYKHLNALQTVGYSEIIEHLEGKISLEVAIEKVKQNTRRFAKRQLTWFRRDKEINWFDPVDVDKILAFIEEKTGLKR